MSGVTPVAGGAVTPPAHGGGFSVFVAGLAILLNLVAVGLAGFAISYHGIGHVSMDSSMQLYEASLGRSVTWNPPGMSAILRWLGTGPEASRNMVIVNSVATYFSLAATAAALLMYRHNRQPVKYGAWLASAGFLLCVLILVNPVLWMYVGIVWKDVLFSSFMLAGAATGLIAMTRERRSMWLFACLSATLLGAGLKIRQHGIFMSPVLLLLPILAVTWGRGLLKAGMLHRAVGIAAVFLAAVLAMQFAVSRTISTAKEFGDSVGYRGLMMYDVAGILTLSDTPTDQLPIAVPETMREQARAIYSPDRGDFLARSPELMDWMTAGGNDALKQRWQTLVRAEFPAFAEHKLGVWGSVLDLNGVQACLPVHVGIDGDLGNLTKIGFEPGIDARDHAIYGYSRMMLHWPVFRHFAYLAALVIGVVMLAFLEMPSRLKMGALVVASATGLLYLSFLPASVACDFRYLFAAICLVSLFWIVLVTSATGLRNPVRDFRHWLHRRRSA